MAKISAVDSVRRIRAEYTEKYNDARSPAEKAWLAGVVEGATLLYARQQAASLGAVEGRL